MKFRLGLSSILTFGLLPFPVAAAVPDHEQAAAPEKTSLFQIFRLQHKYTLAAHRSHSSHGSHGSHGSHRSSSGGGGGYVVPNPSSGNIGGGNNSSPASGSGGSIVSVPQVQSNSTPPSAIIPESPATAPVTLPGNTEKFYQIALKVQLALSLYGYYTGTVDGIIGPETKAALSKFQSDWGLNVTGTITPEVLDAMGIVAE